MWIVLVRLWLAGFGRQRCQGGHPRAPHHLFGSTVYDTNITTEKGLESSRDKDEDEGACRSGEGGEEPAW